MAEEDGNAHGGDSRSSGDTHACPVWLAGRCDGTTCNCTAGGGQ